MLTDRAELSADNRNIIFSVHEDVIAQKALLLIYAGPAGATSGNIVRFDEIMLVRGNKPALSWSPSIADQEAAIDAARQAADNAAAGVDSLKNFTDEAFADGIVDGTEVEIRDKRGDSEKVHVIGDVPFGHKIAVRDIHKGELIMKYGEEIGIATKEIKKGEYVHIHNLDSMRGRGDWKE